MRTKAYGLAREALSDQRFGDRRRVELLDGDVDLVLGFVDEANDLGLEVVGRAEGAGADVGLDLIVGEGGHGESLRSAPVGAQQSQRIPGADGLGIHGAVAFVQGEL